MTFERRQFLRLAVSAAIFPGAMRSANAEPIPPLAERLADYAHRLRYDELDPVTIEQVKALVVDTLGCAIAAFDEPPVRICREVAMAGGVGAATIIGTGWRVAPDVASFANGAAFRYYDLNDTYVGGLAGHPSDHIAPCLAIAEPSARASRISSPPSSLRMR
jgi:2-methylcitrate dehydratase